LINHKVLFYVSSLFLTFILWSSLRTTWFNVQKFYVLSTQCIYVFCVDLRTHRDYFTIQH
jgi:hypothetical protein